MNERIKELYDRSMKVVSYTDGGYTEIKALDPEKFAELIVRECAELIEHRDCRTQPAPHIYLLKEFGL